MMDTIAIHRLAGPTSKAAVRRTPLRRHDAMTLTNDRELAARFVAGDIAAVEQVVDRHQMELTRLVERMLGWSNIAIAEDLVQEIFVKAIERRGRFNGHASLKTWLTRIAINECRAHLRKTHRRQKLLRWWHAVRPHDNAPSASHAPEQTETARQVRDAVRQLPANCREIVVLVYLEQMTIEQAAQTLGIQLGAAHTRLSRAREKLRGLLDESLLEK
jgi:RNA polymerase sigma-70 factor, ECF subfamily